MGASMRHFEWETEKCAFIPTEEYLLHYLLIVVEKKIVR